MDTLLQDLRYAVRSLRRAPTFVIAAVAILALGIGATTAVFAVVNALLLRPLPIHQPERVMDVTQWSDGRENSVFTYPFYEALSDGARGIDLAIWDSERFSLRSDEGAETVYGAVASGNYFRLLGVSPARGRLFTPADDKEANPAPVAVLSYATWRRRFGGAEGVVGRSIYLDGHSVTVVGIAPRGFTGTTVGVGPELWVPITLEPLLREMPTLLEEHQIQMYDIVGRLASGISAEQAAAMLTARAQALPAEDGGGPQARIALHRVTGLPVGARGATASFLAVFLAAAGLVLLIAAVNVASVLLARAAGRSREVAVRLAVGAGRGRLVRQLLTENLLLFMLGGGAGVLLASWLTELLLAIPLPIPVPVVLNLSLDPPVLLFALALSLATGLGFGLAPALQATRYGPAEALKDTAHPTRRSRLRNAFVVGQIALSLLLLVTAGLFVRSLQRAWTLDPGFEPDGLVVANFDFFRNGYDAVRGHALIERLRARLDALPEVESTAVANASPLQGNLSFSTIEIPGNPATPPGHGIRADQNWVTPEYFRTMRIPLMRGRGFTRTDGAGAPHVAIVSETLARHFWPAGDAVGGRLRIGSDVAEIVGVAGDVQNRELGVAPGRYFYLPLAQSPSGYVSLIARTDGSEASLLASLRTASREIDPDAPMMSAVVYRDAIEADLLPQRLAAILIGAFGLVGLLLAAMGVYGVIGYSVVQRTREIGIRMALGAGAGRVVQMILRQGVILLCTGIAIGAVAAFAFTRLLASYLFGIGAADPVAFAAASLLLVIVALLAGYFPARRAARVDPMRALRAD